MNAITTTSDVDRFRDLFAANYTPMLAYARRRVAALADADDVVAETFQIAWRRRDRLPVGDEATLYLYGIARKVVANHNRATQRRTALIARLRRDVPAPAAPAMRDEALQAALLSLSEHDREILRLVAWEELDHRQVATVLGITRSAASSRVRRARQRLQEALEQVSDQRTFPPVGDQPRVLGT